MKKYFVLLGIMALIFAGCTSEAAEESGERLTVVATIFPQFDFIRQIAGERVELSMLISPGMESHGFEPSPRDMVSLYGADLMVYTGGHSDDWVARVLASVGREDLRTVALVGLVDTVMAKHHHGHDDDECCCCEDEHHHGHGHHHGHEHHHGHGHHHHEPHYDEHVWTCPRNAIIIVEYLAEVLAEMDAANAEYFRANAAEFAAELRGLDAAFVEVVENAARRTVVFGDRFPFRYFADTYGLEYFAAFDGCSAETQASPARIAGLITLLQDESIPVVFHIEFSNLAIANVLSEATGARLVEMHSAHNVSRADFDAGVTYLDLMRRNVDALREGLN
jgi:zinc transport system substrate-binding protein